MKKQKKSTTTKTFHIAMEKNTKDRFDCIRRKIEFRENTDLDQEDLLIRMINVFEAEVINK